MEAFFIRVRNEIIMPKVRRKPSRLRKDHPARTARSFDDNDGLPVAHALALPPPWESYPAPSAIEQMVRPAFGASRGRASTLAEAMQPVLDHLLVRTQVDGQQ